ncbi:imelysin family protein [Parashewanella tropica]|uniref:imelysin family protein n=1 Tax=Parashewanella tropica TaxID=2547970 RepID=UPI00105A485C|nr:imelysin family protein [Parashewanella tropica]
MNRKPLLSKLMLALAATTLIGCGESTSSSSGKDFNKPPTNNTDFNEKALIANLVDKVITPTFTQFNEKAKAHSTDVAQFCTQQKALIAGSIEQPAFDSAKQAAQNSWGAAMGVWQQAELMQIGPILDNDKLLRDRIYSWPNINSCAVDYDVTFFRSGTVNGAPYDITRRLPSRKGLGALEYLLFNDNLNHSCKTGSPDGWANLTDNQKKIARCEFATEVAKDLANNASNLVTVWNNYVPTLKEAGSTGNPFKNEHEAVNRLSDAMFYLDKATKDGKLGKPLGLQVNACGAEACPEDVESKFAEKSLAHIINNLRGFDRLLQGESGIGFTAYLKDVGAKDTADAMVADVQKAIVNAEAYQVSLKKALQDNSDQVTETHGKVKNVTDKLKTDFINRLALELPKTSAGDND